MFNRLVAQAGGWVQSVRLLLTDAAHRLGDNRAAPVCRVRVTDASAPSIRIRQACRNAVHSSLVNDGLKAHSCCRIIRVTNVRLSNFLHRQRGPDMNGTRNWVFTKQLLAGLSVTLCAASYLAFDSLNSASVAQPRPSDRCERTKVVDQWLDQHREARIARDDLNDLIDAVNRKYQDGDFGYDPKSNKDRKQELKNALDEARHNFGRIIRSVAYNSTPACRICALDEVYQDAAHGGEGDNVTVQELEHFRFLGLFSRLAPDWQELERKKDQRRELEAREPTREVREEIDDVVRTIDVLSRSVDRDREDLDKFRHSPEWDRDSPKMAIERTKYVCGGEGPGDRPGDLDTRGEQPPPGRR